MLQSQPVLLMLSNMILFSFLNSKMHSIIKFLPGKKTCFKMLFTTWIQDATPIAALTAATKRLLWHQCLGHPSDQYLYTAHKFINGVPNFKHHDPVLDKCPVCIRSKQPKTPGCGTTMKDNCPMQGYSINLAFTGRISKDSDVGK